jgi:hypothetical protein
MNPGRGSFPGIAELQLGILPVGVKDPRDGFVRALYGAGYL